MCGRPSPHLHLASPSNTIKVTFLSRFPVWSGCFWEDTTERYLLKPLSPLTSSLTLLQAWERNSLALQLSPRSCART